MRLLVVCQHYWPEPFNVSETCEQLVERGHEVTVLTGLPNCPEGVVDEAYRRGRLRTQKHNGVTIVRAPIFARGRHLRGFGKIRRVLNYVSFPISATLKSRRLKEDFDAVLVVQYSPVLMAIPGLQYAKKHGIPCLLYCFDLWPEDMLSGGVSKQSRAFGVMKSVSRRIYADADAVAITSPDFVKYFDDELGLNDIRCFLLPQYAEYQFESIAEKQSEKDTIDILFAGNVGANQAVTTIVRAASKVKDDDRIRIHIVGSGSLLDECKALAQEIDATNVVFHGRKPFEEMPRFYEMADAMLLTLAAQTHGSLVGTYTIPRKMQSYMAAGRPVVVSSDGVSARLVEESDCGLWSAAEDADGLADSMRQLADLSPERRLELGRNARRAYEEGYSRQAFFSKLEDQLADLTHRK